MKDHLVDRARFLAAGQDDPHSVTITELVDRIVELEAEMARRDANEIRNCLNWGPCSRHDGRMSEPGAIAKGQPS